MTISKRGLSAASIFALCIALSICWVVDDFGDANNNADTEALPVEYVKTTAVDLEVYPGHPISPIPLNVEVDANKAALGEKLFNETLLSVNNKVACSTCHDLQQGGAVNEATTLGVTDERGVRNVPTIFNVGFNFSYFWDGRAKTLAAQIEDVLLNPIEMGNSWQALEKKLNNEPFYVEQFLRVYGTRATRTAIIDALVAFQTTLTTPDSRFDQYIRGDESALTEQEVQGYELFQTMGCVACHQGVNAGGNLYQKLGVFKAYQAVNNTRDMGRFSITQKEEDKYVFKVPSLRNIELTAPYLHDGSIASLEEVVSIMGEYQLGRNLSDAEVEKLAAFLRTLTGEYLGEQ